MMTQKELEKKVDELRGLEQMAKELEILIEGLKDEIKEEMTERDTDKLTTGLFDVTWKRLCINRFDTGEFRKTHAELYRQYTKRIETRRFAIT